MTKTSSLALLLLSALAASTLAAGCGGSDDSSATTGDEEEARAKGQCKIVDEGQTGLSATKILANGDPVAQKILKGTGTCPKTFTEVVARLKTTDKTGCADGSDGTAGGMQVRLVSERSQVLGKPDSYRAVVTRQCDGRPVHGLFISVFGIGAGVSALPQSIELIGFDPAQNVFNYYELADGAWKFFGSSRDLVKDGYSCKSGACAPKAPPIRRCALCHTGGGLIMKELNSPWVHWEGDTQTPGADAMATSFKSLWGTKSNGIELESTVSAGNKAWITKRIELAKAEGSVADLLRPLFCTVEVNVQSSSTSTGATNMTKVRGDFFTDPFFGKTFDSVAINSADYVELMGKNGQKVQGEEGQLKGPDGKLVLDTVFPFTFLERSSNDVEYVKALVAAGILDDELAKDVLVLDFTRPIFSKSRCDMAQFVPEVDPASRTAKAIADGMLASLKKANPAPGTVAAELKTNLETAGQAAAHTAKLDTFLAACKARPKKELLADVMAIASQRRDLARTLTVFEFPESLPIDSQKIAETKALDPATCKLVDK